MSISNGYFSTFGSAYYTANGSLNVKILRTGSYEFEIEAGLSPRLFL